MKQEITFSKVLPGESFISTLSKRSFGGIKIEDVNPSEEGRPSGDTRNAVILADHVGNRAHDAGALITCELHQLVVVDREKNPGPYLLMKTALAELMEKRDLA